MAYKTTNKERIANHDAIKAERDTLSLALYDLVNGRFSAPVKVKEHDYDTFGYGVYSVRVSMRGMPLFLVHTSDGNSVSVFTENQIDDMRDNYTTYWKCVKAAVSELKRKHYPRPAA